MTAVDDFLQATIARFIDAVAVDVGLFDPQMPQQLGDVVGELLIPVPGQVRQPWTRSWAMAERSRPATTRPG